MKIKVFFIELYTYTVYFSQLTDEQITVFKLNQNGSLYSYNSLSVQNCKASYHLPINNCIPSVLVQTESNIKQMQKASCIMKHTSDDQKLFVHFKPDSITVCFVSNFCNWILDKDHNFSFINLSVTVWSTPLTILYF